MEYVHLLLCRVCASVVVLCGVCASFLVAVVQMCHSLCSVCCNAQDVCQFVQYLRLVW